ncbi:hypothetical protein N9089_02895 [Crocinitomicaceae bacterium]|nr:hypothetical protein [Crocinitomicaceae bacterium]
MDVILSGDRVDLTGVVLEEDMGITLVDVCTRELPTWKFRSVMSQINIRKEVMNKYGTYLAENYDKKTSVRRLAKSYRELTALGGYC